MLQYDPRQHLPTAEDLPETDFQPVDSELQLLVASLLADILAQLWADRDDWFFGVNMGVYYDPERVRGEAHQPLEIYRLEDEEYVLQPEETFWIPEAGLGIGRSVGPYRAWTREWLYWFEQQGNRLLTSAEVVQQERQLREDLFARLRARGIDPDTL